MSKQKEKVNKEERNSDIIDEVYNANDFNHLQVPSKISIKTIVICLILCVVLSLLCGLLGGLFILTSQKLTIPFVATWDLSERLPKREITIQTREEITITQDEHITELMEQLGPQLVKIFSKQDVSSLNVIDQINLDKKALGRGSILTNDGWVMTVNGVAEAGQEYLAVTSDNQTYSIEKIVEDPLTGLVFLKLASASKNFSVIKLAEEVASGERILVLKDSKALEVSYVNDIKYQDIKISEDLIMSAEKLQEFILLGKDFDPGLAGGPVINFDGSVVGVLRSLEARTTEEESDLVIEELINTAISVDYFKSAIDQLLKFGEIRRPKLGVEYLNLARASGIVNSRFKDYKKGALLYGTPGLGTVAREAGLKNADVISKVNNDIVNGRYSLTELIQQYLPGDEIELFFMRGETEKVVKVKLGEM
ncbi:S1C family serine protease [Patescibacteria group bacterium]|nr:S1C family serine protease [Patescibacteria group bacterium]MBU4511687.1 S1C family serine protease [Patescibacteria group bacterium]